MPHKRCSGCARNRNLRCFISYYFFFVFSSVDFFCFWFWSHNEACQGEKRLNFITEKRKEMRSISMCTKIACSHTRSEEREENRIHAINQQWNVSPFPFNRDHSKNACVCACVCGSMFVSLIFTANPSHFDLHFCIFSGSFSFWFHEALNTSNTTQRNTHIRTPTIFFIVKNGFIERISRDRVATECSQ